MFGIEQLFSLIKIINSAKGETSVAAGFSLGMVMGFVPSNPLLLLAFFFVFCVFRIHGGAMFLGWAIFGVLALFLDPLFDTLGYALLTQYPALQAFFTKLYNLPVFPWTRFNNSIVAGSLVTSFILFLPSLFLFRSLIRKYRQTVLERIKGTKWFKAWKTTGIYKLYTKYERVKETMA